MGVIMVVETHMKPIANYPNYQIDNAGNVYSIAWNKFRLLKPIPTHDGYYRVCLCKDNNKKILSILKFDLLILKIVPFIDALFLTLKLL